MSRNFSSYDYLPDSDDDVQNDENDPWHSSQSLFQQSSLGLSSSSSSTTPQTSRISAVQRKTTTPSTSPEVFDCFPIFSKFALFIYPVPASEERMFSFF